MAAPSPAHVLVEFGFTALESEIYAFLLRESPVTGYRVAQAIGKPAANTYKAIQSLEQKGAVVVDHGASRMCRAVPSDELLGRLAREFEARRTEAQETLRRLGNPAADDRIYQIRSVDLVLQKAREMAEEAQESVLLLASPEFLAPLREALEGAAVRGVDVVVGSQGADIAGVDVVETAVPAHGRELQAVVDGSQSLTALLNEDGQEVLTALWTRNPHLVLLQHKALSGELCLAALAEKVEEGAGPKRLTRTLAQRRSMKRE